MGNSESRAKFGGIAGGGVLILNRARGACPWNVAPAVLGAGPKMVNGG